MNDPMRFSEGIKATDTGKVFKNRGLNRIALMDMKLKRENKEEEYGNSFKILNMDNIPKNISKKKGIDKKLIHWFKCL